MQTLISQSFPTFTSTSALIVSRAVDNRIISRLFRFMFNQCPLLDHTPKELIHPTLIVRAKCDMICGSGVMIKLRQSIELAGKDVILSFADLSSELLISCILLFQSNKPATC